MGFGCGWCGVLVGWGGGFGDEWVGFSGVCLGFVVVVGCGVGGVVLLLGGGIVGGVGVVGIVCRTFLD
ncbi:hypothetical protein, partial [Pseudomonas syringae group genomosp. 7]|uniref:hypothetical protein n=1 Tax=Pseudomonas syringae group genomosp. 7 TaxID=251699 RepID=UPI00376FDEDD